jgi:hypothetical protein
MGSRAGCAVNHAKGKQPTLAVPTMDYLARLLDWLVRMLCAQLGRRISGSCVVSVLVAFFYLPSRPVGGFGIMLPIPAAFDSVFTVRVACSMPRVVWH